MFAFVNMLCKIRPMSFDKEPTGSRQGVAYDARHAGRGLWLLVVAGVIVVAVAYWQSTADNAKILPTNSNMGYSGSHENSTHEPDEKDGDPYGPNIGH